MEQIIKTAAVGIICAVCISVVREHIPSFAPFAECAAILAVIFQCIDIFRGVSGTAEKIFSLSLNETEYYSALFKSLLICIASKISADICRDSGNSALAFGVETAGKAAVILIIMPMLLLLAKITEGLVKG